MRTLITETFLEHIPTGREEAVLEKMARFVEDYLASGFNMPAMRHGVSVREIKNNRHGLRIFKFRVSRSDRILFTFDSYKIRPELRRSILFLDYVLHDDQGDRGRQIGVANQEIIPFGEEEEAFDRLVDARFQNFDYDPNQVITRVIDLKTMASLLDSRDEKAVYYLNDEQFQCLQPKEAPAFIFGSAGSGKTTINIYKLYLLSLQPYKTAYFTYSPYLVDDAVKLFQKVASITGSLNPEEAAARISFHPFNDYLSRQTGCFQLVRFEEFHRWVISSHPLLLRQAGLETSHIWKEIRGLLKGMIPKEWLEYRVETAQSGLRPETEEQLLRKGLARRQEAELVLNAQQLYEAKKSYLDPETLRGVLLMHRLLDGYLTSNPVIGLEIYQNLDSQYTTLTSQQRQAVYSICQSYQEYLDAAGKVDENDLARRFLALLVQAKTPLFDYVVADEIQDLTEIQLYALVRLAKNRNQLLFSGDVNQTIRPTYFNTGRIESILKTSNTHLAFQKHVLVKNYRSSEEVVELANHVIDLRIAKLGSRKKDDYRESPIRRRQSDVFYCDFSSEDEVVRLLRTGLNRHYVAVVVAQEQEKEHLQRLTNTRGAVFTVEEIKGIEKDYIICYNIMSCFKQEWDRIMDGTSGYPSQDRYYFNLLYVALTRARHQLCLVESDVPAGLYHYLESHFRLLDHFDEADFKLAAASTDNQFYQEAQRYERRELYTQAQEAYRRSGLKEGEKAIRRCQALLASKEGRHREAAAQLFKIGEHALAARCSLQGGHTMDYLKALVYQGLPFEEIASRFSMLGLDVVEFFFGAEEKQPWTRRFNQLYALSLNRRLKAADRIQRNLTALRGSE